MWPCVLHEDWYPEGENTLVLLLWLAVGVARDWKGRGVAWNQWWLKLYSVSVSLSFPLQPLINHFLYLASSCFTLANSTWMEHRRQWIDGLGCIWNSGVHQVNCFVGEYTKCDMTSCCALLGINLYLYSEMFKVCA